jgi:hypothetical protein
MMEQVWPKAKGLRKLKADSQSERKRRNGEGKKQQRAQGTKKLIAGS